MESGVLFQFQCMGPIGFASQGPILGLVSSQSFEHVSHECYGLDPPVRSPFTMRSVVASSVSKRLIGSEPS